MWKVDTTEGDQPQRYSDARLEWERQVMGDLDEVISTKWIGKDKVIASNRSLEPFMPALGPSRVMVLLALIRFQ